MVMEPDLGLCGEAHSKDVIRRLSSPPLYGVAARRGNGKYVKLV
jgi:hypothetical protein